MDDLKTIFIISGTSALSDPEKDHLERMGYRIEAVSSAAEITRRLPPVSGAAPPEANPSRETLRERAEKLNLMLDGIDALLAYVGEDLRYVAVNRAYADWYGRSKEEIAGMPVGELLDKQVYERALPHYLRALSGETVQFENRTADREGKERFVSVSLVPHFAGGRVVGFFGAITDVTARRLAEDAARLRLREKEMLLREVHHRIKNNINSIAGLVCLQAASTSSAEAGAVLLDCVSRIKSMGVLYEKLLISDDYEELSAADYVDGLVGSITGLFEGALKVAVEKRIGNFRLASKTLFLLGIVINELMTNSLKYAFAGRENGTIGLSLEEKGGEIRLVIKDDGNGLSTPVKKEPRSGFGFELVEMITQQLGGKFAMTSGAGGTSATLEFRP